MMYDKGGFNFTIWDEAEIKKLEEIGEFFGAGFLEGKDKPIVLRMAHALKNHLSKVKLPEYKGSRLYPSKTDSFWKGSVLEFMYAYFNLNSEKLQELTNKADCDLSAILEKYNNFLNTYPAFNIIGYNHTSLNYGRFLQEGLQSYKKRIDEAYSKSIKPSNEKRDFLEALSIVHEGIQDFIHRILDYLTNLQFNDVQKQINSEALIRAFELILTDSADSFESAMIASNFLYYLDGCDGIGRFDQFMEEYYLMSKESGKLTPDAALEWIKEFWENIDVTIGWNVTLGGSKNNGEPAYNELTLLALKAAKGRRHPNLTLRIREDVPQEVWSEALESISNGTGIPALYCEENYIKALEEARVNIVKEDIYNFNFGGCTETMIHGCSNVGSTDVFINVLKIFEDVFYEYLEKSESFLQFQEFYKGKLREAILSEVLFVNRGQEDKAKYFPQLIRSLFVDDCIDTARDFNAGGARNNWATVGIVGLNNVIDSLYVIQEIIFNKKDMTASTLVNKMKSNFEGDLALQKKLLSLPKFGNGISEVDKIGHDISNFIFTELKNYAYWRGGKFLGSIINFIIYDYCGTDVGATPDGRSAYSSLGDSAGAVQGRDKKGPTALLDSVTNLDLVNATQTPVVNMRFSRRMFTDMSARDKVKSLICTYFKNGGMQIQINVVDQEILEDAVKHPEKHENLIIRLGGYSEYFNNLTEEMKKTILERTEHSL